MLENEIHISEDNLTFNYQYYKNLSNKNIIAVLKSNAYGHGLIEIAKILDSLNVYMIAISNISEGIKLRQNNIKAKLLVLEPIEVKDMLNCYYYHLTPVISSLQQFNRLNKARFFASLPMHLEIDSGMHRSGINLDEAKIINEKLTYNSNLKLTGIFTHLIGDESYIEFIENQKTYFKEILEIFDTKDLCIHMCSSKSINLDIVETNAIRIGLGLYGLKDVENTKQVLSIYSPITNISLIKKNELAGYDNSFKANNNGYIYTIPLGYQSGLLSKYKLTPTIDNKRLYTAGKRCMNQTLLFSKNLYFLGQMVCLVNEEHSLTKLAKTSKQSIYEIISLLNPNIKRIVM